MGKHLNSTISVYTILINAYIQMITFFLENTKNTCGICKIPVIQNTRAIFRYLSTRNLDDFTCCEFEQQIAHRLQTLTQWAISPNGLVEILQTQVLKLIQYVSSMLKLQNTPNLTVSSLSLSKFKNLYSYSRFENINF